MVWKCASSCQSSWQKSTPGSLVSPLTFKLKTAPERPMLWVHRDILLDWPSTWVTVHENFCGCCTDITHFVAWLMGLGSVDQCDCAGYMWYIRESYKLSLSHHLLCQRRLLPNLFIKEPVVNLSLPSMLGRHTVAFRTGCTSFTAMRIIGSLFKFLMPALIVF